MLVNIKFNLQYGELIPVNSVVRASIDGQSKQYPISELIDNEIVSGKYYVENSVLFGSGEGYGAAGKAIIYPEVSFDVKIIKDVNEQNADDSETPSESSSEPSPTESQTPSEDTSDLPNKVAYIFINRGKAIKL